MFVFNIQSSSLLLQFLQLLVSLFLAACLFAIPAHASGDIQSSTYQFIQKDASDDKARERFFAASLSDHQSLLQDSEDRLSKAEQHQTDLKKDFDSNEAVLIELESRLSQRSSGLGEVFGVAKESAMELSPMLFDSLTSADNPGRTDALSFAETNQIPTVEDLNALVKQLSVEMQASGEVSQFSTDVVGRDGLLSRKEVIRFGTFSASTVEGQYLSWNITDQTLAVLTTQPEQGAEGVQGYLAANADASNGQGQILLDPTRGQLFALLDRVPNLLERVEQGGTVGYLILSLGAIAILVAIFQMAKLLYTEIGVKRQLQNTDQPGVGNPLGRVLASLQGAKGTESNTLEMQVDEAILRELPKIEQGQSFLKLTAAMAPLMGLLGTVVGMIATFQSITLFGTSDPKLMATGISQALMTTVLGLVVALPVLFSHSLLVTRGRRLVQLLQEKSLATLVVVERQADKSVFDQAQPPAGSVA